MEEAAEFFGAHPKIRRALRLMVETGLGYLKLGQPSPTLSGGEAQRIKLVSQLARRATAAAEEVPDEPSWQVDSLHSGRTNHWAACI